LAIAALLVAGCGSPVDQAQRLIVDNYIEPVDEEALGDAAIEAMLTDLDRHSRLQSAYEVAVTDDAAGVDIKMLTGFAADFVDDELVVLYTWPGSRAERLGLEPGDRIVAINGLGVEEIDFPTTAPSEAVLSAGIARSHRLEKPLTMRIRPDGTSGDSDWDWEPAPDYDAHVERSSARWAGFVEGHPDVGYVYLADFNRGGDADFQAALRQLREAGMRALVLDVRFNPGGIESVVNRVKNLFVAGGVIGIIDEPRVGGRRVTHAKPGLAVYADLPLVMLVNGSSASGAEDLAGCLQDHGRAPLVGTRTRGKGSVQTIYHLDGGRRLSLTTGYFYTPDGRRIQGDRMNPGGVEPDHLVALDEASALRLRSALRHLEPPRERRAELETMLTRHGHPNVLGPLPPALDPQLRKALELLAGE
jgi:carboxyl-terminal processing protease